MFPVRVRCALLRQNGSYDRSWHCATTPESAEDSMQIAPGIHNILTGLQHPTGVTNTYLVHGTAAAAFIDTGWDRPGEAQARIDYWNVLGRPTLAAIVVTHRHPPHWGNAPAIQRACGDAPIIAT